jgi:hypothetical protein
MSDVVGELEEKKEGRSRFWEWKTWTIISLTPILEILMATCGCQP